MINLGEKKDYMKWVCDKFIQKYPRLQLYDEFREKDGLYELGM